VSNVISYIDTLDETYTRLDFVKAILKLEVKELLVCIKDYLETTHLVTFRYFVNRESFYKTTSTSS